DFLGDVDAIDTVQKSLQDSFDVLRDTKHEEEIARDEFIDKRQEQSQLRALQELERKQLEKNEAERKNLLKVTRGKESEYKKVLAQKQKTAASIRTQLFLLQGSPSIPFEKAVEYAEEASQKTGVRVAFVLGVIAQESDLGRNVGQCNLPGDPPNRKWQKIMKPSRDHEPYRRITSALGLDPDSMPLSCPMSVGWGGAMGPAQFIPSTWELYQDKIARATGHNPPNPWNPEDAFMASAIYLGELGANTRAGESKAAAKYFAGGNWNSSLGRAYASQVLAKVETYQGQIDLIKSVATR
ncbi:MAG: lytic murein transglycosylase, partial [Candidatus Ryanbacteria bacterium]|nr:lytic murein transglycosylase [Candidatus Ryanbacteria bacterium]